MTGAGTVRTARAGARLLAGEEWLPVEVAPGAVPLGDVVPAEGLWWVALRRPAAGGADLEAATADLYRELLERARGRHLARVWNSVPGINAAGPDGLENYRRFCRARAEALEAGLGGGGDFNARLPAASAVGTDGEDLVVRAALSDAEPEHFENPAQVPAYRYPVDYGPRPPSFARATRVARADGGTWWFVSGTSAIRGHASCAPGDTAAQVEVTVENLEVMERVCGVAAAAGGGRLLRRYGVVFLRHAADLAGAQAALAGRLWRAGDGVAWVRADICRVELNVEVELHTTDCADGGGGMS